MEEGNVRALHQTRVASRRLREVLPVLELDADIASRLARRLRKVTNRLGRVRELDVLMILVDDLRKTRRFDEHALDRVAAAVTRDRDKARARLASKLSADSLSRLATKVGRAAGQVGNEVQSPAAVRRHALRWALDARVARRAAQLREAIEDAGAVYLPDRLHAVRIALKKLRYALELAEEAAGVQPSGDLRLLKRTQDALGSLHDHEVFIDRLRQLQASTAPTDLPGRGEIDKILRSLEDTSRRLHGRYMRNREAIIAICDRHSASPARRTGARRAS